MENYSRLCIHTITTKPWNLKEAVEKYAAAGVGGISVWREALQGYDLAAAGKMIRDAGLEIVSLVRGGFFPAKDEAGRKAAETDNLQAIAEAEALGAPAVVLVPGAVPGLPLSDARDQIEEGIRSLLPRTTEAGVKLSIEPLHPMYADSRSAINTLASANDMAERIDSDMVGIAVDVYHLWWDPDLQAQIKRCGEKGNLFAFHICDWLSPTEDMLNDRGLMGEGCIPIKEIRGWVEEAGFSGFNEVEIFSTQKWAMNQDAFLKEIQDAYRNHA